MHWVISGEEQQAATKQKETNKVVSLSHESEGGWERQKVADLRKKQQKEDNSPNITATTTRRKKETKKRG